MKAKRALTGAAAVVLGAAGLTAAPAVSAHDHGHASHITVTVEERHHARPEPYEWSGWHHEVWTYRTHDLPPHGGWGGWRHGWSRWGHHRPRHGGARLGWSGGAPHHGGHGGWAVTLYGGH